ncbi:MAG TPA: SMP-30/gluconolactonase/LRE family protein [Candidatus Acidoferrum sp.]|nr:SMP-30/gluconolactonase/LRE family protein [Candidatus Acidoferrum sp.]
MNNVIVFGLRLKRRGVEESAIRVAGALVATCVVVLSAAWSANGQTQARQFRLQADDPKFWQLIDKNAELNKVAGGFGFTEGPIWDERGFLYVSDEEQNKVYKVTEDGRKEALISLGDPDGNAYDRGRRLIDCASVLRAIIEITPDGKYRVLADKFDGKKFNSPNDVVLGPDGALYFTDPTLDLVKGEKQEIPFQGVYRLDEKGNVTLLTKDLTQPNGLAFSPDGKRFYVDDSEQRNIRVYDVAPDGTLKNGRIFGSEPGAPHEGVPDGMRVDAEGNLYVTGPKGIWVWDSGGNHLGTIEMPEQPANLIWGGADFRVLYITATTSVYKLQTRARGFVPYAADLHTRALARTGFPCAGRPFPPSSSDAHAPL